MEDKNVRVFDLFPIIIYKSGPKEFPNDRPAIQTALYRIREEVPPHLNQVVFKKHVLFARSKEVDDFFFIQNFMHTTSPSMDTYYIKKDLLEKNFAKTESELCKKLDIPNLEVIEEDLQKMIEIFKEEVLKNE